MSEHPPPLAIVVLPHQELLAAAERTGLPTAQFAPLHQAGVALPVHVASSLPEAQAWAEEHGGKARNWSAPGRLSLWACALASLGMFLVPLAVSELITALVAWSVGSTVILGPLLGARRLHGKQLPVVRALQQRQLGGPDPLVERVDRLRHRVSEEFAGVVVSELETELGPLHEELRQGPSETRRQAIAQVLAELEGVLAVPESGPDLEQLRLKVRAAAATRRELG